MAKKYDFSGWATRNDLLCSDGVVIKAGAFAHMDGQTVPLVYGHNHESAKAIIGNALLEVKPEGVYMWGSFNDNDEAKYAKEGVMHGDIKYLSIYANRVKRDGGNVIGGNIKEVSLVPFGGANPGAFIDNAVIAHADGTYSEADDEAVIFLGDYGVIEHADKSEKKEDKEVAKKDEGRSPEEILNEMTDEQLELVDALINTAVDAALSDDEDDEDGEGEDYDDADDGDVEHNDGGNGNMKYNAFEGGAPRRSDVITHADQEAILAEAKKQSVGSFKQALEEYMADNELQHDGDPVYPSAAAPVAGFVTTGNIGDGKSAFNAILPEFKEVRPGAPEVVYEDQGWVSHVMNKVHKSPISRIRTTINDIRQIETEGNTLRARGYKKGEYKEFNNNMNLVRRTTEPQTIYVKSALHRDDIVDITDFDYVNYLYNIDQMMLKEELARAILVGDGRDVNAEDKIFPDKIRPIWTDAELYTMHVDLDLEATTAELQGTDTEQYFGDNFVKSEAMVNTILYAMERFKGSAGPDMFLDPHWISVMLLARDRNGHRMYSSKNELATALSVGSIQSVEKFKNLTRTVTVDGVEVTKKLIALIVNLGDYALGSTKGGQVTHFTDFDLNFNQQLSLLETRCSGALTRIQSAIAIEMTVA